MPMPQAPRLSATSRPVPPPLQLLWLMTSEGPVPYFLRTAEQILPPDCWVPLALTTQPVL